MDTPSVLILIGIPCLIISSEAVDIKQCDQGNVMLQTNQVNLIICEGFNDNDTVTWEMITGGVGRVLATCCYKDDCTLHDATSNVYRGSNSVTLHLFGNVSLNNSMLKCAAKGPTAQFSIKLLCNIIMIAPVPVTTLEASSTAEETSTFGSGTSHEPEGSGQQQSSDKSKDSSEDEVPVGAIAGGAVAAVAVVIVVIVVVVIISRRRRRDKHGAATNAQDSNELGTRNNAAYGTVGDAGDLNQPYDTGSPEIGIYACPGGDEAATIPDNTPVAEEDNFGMYAAPKQDVYAAVDKSKPKKNKPAASDHLDTSQAAAVTDEYAVVNKASKKKEASNSTGLSEVHIPQNNDVTAAPVPYIYAQVDKTAKPAKTAISVPRTPNEEGATYAQVHKPK